jgi:signal transduction histidine kinase
VATLLVFTGLLAALLFPWAVALALEFVLLLIYLGINIAFRGWGYLVFTGFVAGTFADLFLVITVGFLRRAWELAEEARQKEKDLAALKDQFIANIHHELRTPLACILGSLDILRDNGHNMSEEEQHIFLDQAVYAGNELGRIVENVLDAAQADSDISSPWIRVFELDRVVLDELHRIDTFGHALHVDICEGLLVEGDSEQVGQVMRNLLSNGLKYVPKESPITVRAWRDGALAYVCVKDEGPGIPAFQIPLIFQKFSRLERDIAGPVRGIGLGLYICRRLIENMGGRIWVESTGVAGEGSSFYFTLPVAL